ncbi:amino acid adenylation domain-containing protein [Streptomyces zhaozhouensis]|uniref:Amino acid adenylation domain-containing protein n=1 Tax=Streptomyces zhaozhouensis TaxID=1300267 RepID=A0A286DSI9_9ACTN|nr:AMP-binding protein [Streptomyces zhaozhouensis]SOD61619.1 amino acid adenylation domain-containing protein [Streptomyces zhaozhouensis]
MSSNGTLPPRAHASVDNLRTYLLAAGAKTPHRAAVIQAAPGGGLETVSWGELEARTDRCVEALDALGLDVGDRVIIESDTSAEAVATLLACATLGLPFVPVAPGLPDERLRAIIASAEPALYLQTVDGKRADIPEQVGTGRFGPEGVVVERQPVRRGPRRRRTVTPVDTAYIIFTSGTTGRPKGVAMSHRGVISFLRGARAADFLTIEDRVAGTAPLQFDFALFDIGFALSHGATLVPVPRDRLTWPRRLLAFLREAEVTQVHAVPSVWRPVLRHEPEMLAELGDRGALRGILFSGEAFPLNELRGVQALLPKARFINLYGPTECMAVSVTELPNPLPNDAERLSIGRAIPGAEVTLIGADGQSVEEPGVIGEIYLRSTSLFNGYWNDPETTRATLVPDPLHPRSGQLVLKTGDLASRGADGELYFHGRADSQVQIRGNRVELGEVETRVAAFPGITGAVASVLPHEEDEPQLHVFVTCDPGEPAPDARKVAAFCRTALPVYMVPHKMHVVDEFPLSANGKVDRTALRALVSS